jgi:hypothetical protein
MFPRIGEVIAALDELKTLGLIHDYAIAGAFGMSVWDEVSTTFDVDVLVLVDASKTKLIVDMTPFYEWAAERGYEVAHEHIKISEVWVQIMPTPDALAEEAVAQAEAVEMMGKSVKVVTPEYLAAMWLKPPANSAKRTARIEQMRESGVLDEATLADIRERYNLS